MRLKNTRQKNSLSLEYLKVVLLDLCSRCYLGVNYIISSNENKILSEFSFSYNLTILFSNV